MKPILRQITSTPEQSFLIRKDVGENMANKWHYHPEIELLFIKRSTGTWLVGDHIGYFKSGDVILIGANLPHCFRHEYDYIMKREEAAGETICIKFEPGFFGNQFLGLPECREIQQLLIKCNQGLKLTGKTRAMVTKLIDKICELSQGKKLLQLLSILEMIAESKEYLALSSKGFVQKKEPNDKDRIKQVFEYTFNHYSDKIKIEELAALVFMTKASFCRYFKSKTNKTYIRFLMEVRVGHACRLLVEEDKNVSEIGYLCGYNCLSHFNHQFKFITGKNPVEYRKNYLKED